MFDGLVAFSPTRPFRFMPYRPSYFRQQYQAPAADVVRGSAAARGYDGVWRRFREQVLREEPICRLHNHPAHKDECTLEATIVDHIVPLAAGGARLERANVRPVCRRAHEQLTQNWKQYGINELAVRPRGAKAGAQ